MALAPPAMRISTLALVVMQALVLTLQAPSVRGNHHCPAGCSGLGSPLSRATFRFEGAEGAWDAGYKKISGTCHGKANQDCPLIAPRIFRCCDEFTFVTFPGMGTTEVHISHDATVSVQRFTGTLRSNLSDWENTKIIQCTTEPPLLAGVDFVPPKPYRMHILEVCYNHCNGAGSVCGDPKLVGGDGVAFYFHGRKDQDFCLVSDSDLHINAHFIGKRPAGRTRDFTWVQALGFVYGSHTLTIAAKRTEQWDSAVDHLEFVYNGEALALNPTSSWASPGAAMTLTRTGVPNVVDLEIKEKMGVSLNAVPIGKHESDVHQYGITGDDCFAHFDMQFRFHNLSTVVHGVLGQTYQPGFVNPAKQGVAMPVVGGADRFGSSSLLATDCAVSQYTATALAHGSALPRVATACGSSGLPDGVPGGITCRR